MTENTGHWSQRPFEAAYCWTLAWYDRKLSFSAFLLTDGYSVKCRWRHCVLVSMEVILGYGWTSFWRQQMCTKAGRLHKRNEQRGMKFFPFERRGGVCSALERLSLACPRFPLFWIDWIEGVSGTLGCSFELPISWKGRLCDECDWSIRFSGEQQAERGRSGCLVILSTVCIHDCWNKLIPVALMFGNVVM